MSVTTPITTTASSDSITPFEQALSSLLLYTATTTATTVSYICSSGHAPLLIPTSSGNAASQSLPTLYYQNLYELLLTSTLSHRDTHEPGVPLLVTCTIHENTHGTQQFATSCLPKLTLPSFSGNPPDWQSFWDLFSTAIHLNPNLVECKNSITRRPSFREMH